MIRERIRKWLGFEKEEEATIKVKYFSVAYIEDPLEYTGDWVDVRACEGVQYFHNQGKSWTDAEEKVSPDGRPYIDLYPNELVKIPLGFALKLPENHEAIMKVRSSTSKNTGLLMATSGVIDEGYCGPQDEWFAVLYSTRPERLYLGERICQFRIQKKQPKINFEEVTEFTGPNRGGHGSTGRF